MKCRITPDGNIVFNTRTEAVKVSDDDGGVIWRYEFEDASGLDEILCIEEDAILVAGYTNSFGEGSTNIFVAKLDSDGNLEWQEAYGTEDMEFCLGLIETTHSEFCMVGVSRYANGAGDYHPYILLINAEGELIWQRVYDDYRGMALRDLVETDDGGFAVVGHGITYSLMRIDYSGELIWYTYYGYDNWEPPYITGDAYSIHLMEDGGYLLGGFASVGCFLIRTEPDTVDLPFELEALTETYEFEDLPVDSIASWDLQLHNPGRRYVVINSVTLDGEAFSCDFEARRVEPEDTVSFAVTFQPSEETSYADTARFWFGEQSVEVTLSGRGIPLNAVEDDNVWLLPNFELISIHPNPFNSLVQIRYALPHQMPVKVVVHDVSGREVVRLFDGIEQAGIRNRTWIAANMPVGIYFIKVAAGSEVATAKVTLLK